MPMSRTLATGVTAAALLAAAAPAVATPSPTGPGVAAVAAAPAPVPRPVAKRPAPARPAPKARPARPRSPIPIRRVPAGSVVHLTFDDGPSSAWTPEVLQLLRRHRAAATFFLVGREAQARPRLVERIRADGHAVGNHTYSHPRLTGATPQLVAAEIERGSRHLRGRTTCLRPPGGNVDDEVRAAARRAGQRVALWDVDTADWRRPGADAIADAVARDVRPGSVVLLHDGGGDRSQTVEALRALLPRLSAAGYRFTTLPACR